MLKDFDSEDYILQLLSSFPPPPSRLPNPRQSSAIFPKLSTWSIYFLICNSYNPNRCNLHIWYRCNLHIWYVTIWTEINLESQGISNLIYHARDKHTNIQYARSHIQKQEKISENIS